MFLGNPGIIDFYEHFAIDLNQKTNSPVIGISHTGHLYHDSISSWKPKPVIGQIMDKIKFIEKHLGDEYKFENIILIGHSIGCYVIIELLELINEEFKKKIKKSFLFFPTIERMSTTPNGKVLTFFSNFFSWLVYFLAFLLTFLPNKIRKEITKFGLNNRHGSVNNENLLIDGIEDIVLKMSHNYSCFRSCFHMGADEMKIVTNLNKKAVEQNIDRLYFYYGSNDKWCPIGFYHDMMKYMNEIGKKNANIHLDQLGLEHAFIIFKKQCEIISNLVQNNSA